MSEEIQTGAEAHEESVATSADSEVQAEESKEESAE